MRHMVHYGPSTWGDYNVPYGYFGFSDKCTVDTKQLKKEREREIKAKKVVCNQDSLFPH